MARAQSVLAGYPGAQSAGSINPGFFLEGIRHSDLGMIRANAQPTPAASTKTIRNDVNLKKTTLRLVRDELEPRRFHVEFSFDTNVECLVSVHYAAVEAAGPAGAPRFSPLRGPAKPHKEKRPKGVGQAFRTRPEHALDTTRYSPADLQYDAGVKRYPLVVHLEVAPSAAPTASVSSQTTFADLVWEGPALVARPLKQKIQVGKLAYEMQEIYGIEGGAKPTAQPAASDADADPVDDADAILENGRECVVCMTEERDTAVLPCRHMCASPAAPRRARARSAPPDSQVHVQRVRQGAPPAVEPLPDLPHRHHVAAPDPRRPRREHLRRARQGGPRQGEGARGQGGGPRRARRARRRALRWR